MYYLSLHRINNFPSDLLGLYLGIYGFLIDQVIADSPYNGTVAVICFSILFAKYLIDIFTIKKSISIKDKLSSIRDNLELFLIVGVCLWPIVFSINLILLSLGIVTIVNISTPTLFIYTFLPKFTIFKCIFTCVICYVTKEVKLQNFTLSLSSLVFIILYGGFSYYYIIPYLHIITSLVLTKSGAMLKYSSVLMDG
jgi:nitrate reductase NapE component